MGRSVLLSVSVAIAVLLACGVALAATIQCPNRAGNLCVGTAQGDLMTGRDLARDDIRGVGGADTLRGLGEPDHLFGGPGADLLRGGADDDILIGGTGNDTLEGQGGPDRYDYETNNWGDDFITDASASDNKWFNGNGLLFRNMTQALTINLDSSSSRPEVANAARTSTINWLGTTIDNVSNNFNTSDDRIDGNYLANRITSRGGFDTIYAGGGSDIIAVNDGVGGDFVDCGGPSFSADNDTVFYDADDTVTNCETLNP